MGIFLLTRFVKFFFIPRQRNRVLSCHSNGERIKFAGIIYKIDMSRIKCLLLIVVLISCGSVANAQVLDNIGFCSRTGGDAFVQYSLGGTFGCVLYGESGSLTIASEYMDTTGIVNDSDPSEEDDEDNGVFEHIAIGEGISVYPNPTAYFVNVKVSDSACASGSSDVEIYDVNGVLVFSRAIANHGEEFSVDLSQLANGTYIMRIGKASAKIVKK